MAEDKGSKKKEKAKSKLKYKSKKTKKGKTWGLRKKTSMTIKHSSFDITGPDKSVILTPKTGEETDVFSLLISSEASNEVELSHEDDVGIRSIIVFYFSAGEIISLDYPETGWYTTEKGNPIYMTVKQTGRITGTVSYRES